MSPFRDWLEEATATKSDEDEHESTATTRTSSPFTMDYRLGEWNLNPEAVDFVSRLATIAALLK